MHTLITGCAPGTPSGWSTIMIVSSTSLKMRFMCPSYAYVTHECFSAGSHASSTYVQYTRQFSVSSKLHKDSLA